MRCVLSMGWNHIRTVGCLCGALALWGRSERLSAAAEAKDAVVVAETQLYPVRGQEIAGAKFAGTGPNQGPCQVSENGG